MNFFQELEKYSLNTAVVANRSQQISYKDLLASGDAIAKRVKKRSLIFVVCKNRFESLAGYVGFMRAGTALVLINHTIHDSLLVNLLDRYQPGYLYLPKEKTEAAKDCTTTGTLGGYLLLKTPYHADYPLHDDLALLLTTSGSTGSPKLVRLSHKNIRRNAESIAQYLEITSEDRPITTMPMSYSYGLSIINSHLLKGAPILLTEMTFMDKGFWEAMDDNKATTFGGVPYVYEMLKKLRFSRMNLPSLKYVTQAGGKLSPGLTAEFATLCSERGVRFYTMYGQTEATARISYLPWEHARTKAGSIGIPIPGGELSIKEDGELVYRGDNVAMGYAESCLDLGKGDENGGVLYTGDLAKRDNDGFYYIVGRKKRFLKIYGNRVNLDEIEQLIREAGHDCACTGSDDHLKIYVTKMDDKLQFRKYVSERIGIHQSGFNVVKINKIPRNEAGKVLYSELE